MNKCAPPTRRGLQYSVCVVPQHRPKIDGRPFATMYAASSTDSGLKGVLWRSSYTAGCSLARMHKKRIAAGKTTNTTTERQTVTGGPLRRRGCKNNTDGVYSIVFREVLSFLRGERAVASL